MALTFSLKGKIQREKPAEIKKKKPAEIMCDKEEINSFYSIHLQNQK